MFKTILPLNIILFLRFFGIFLVMPLISIYALSREGATPLLVGVVIGGYALTQSIFQIPFGNLSDKIGRKKVILLGLIIFLIGSIISAVATNIYILMIGRLLQGAGAIGSVISASVSDLVEESHRAKAMAIIGASIGVAFSLAMVVGSTVGVYIGVDKLFYLIAILSIVSMIALIKVKEISKVEIKYNQAGEFKPLRNKEILFFMVSGGLQKGLMTLLFMLIPMLLTTKFHWAKTDLWTVYIPAMVIGLLSMPLAIIIGEKKGNPKILFNISSLLFIVVSSLLLFINSEKLFLTAIILFFFAFNLIEPLIQSIVSKLSPIHQKGKVLGYTNSFSYFGTFIGGMLGGLLYHNLIVLASILIGTSLIWFIWSLKIKNPIKKSSIFLPYQHFLEQRLKRGEFSFVSEWYINRTENLIVIRYLKSECKDIKKALEL